MLWWNRFVNGAQPVQGSNCDWPACMTAAVPLSCLRTTSCLQLIHHACNWTLSFWPQCSCIDDEKSALESPRVLRHLPGHKQASAQVKRHPLGSEMRHVTHLNGSRSQLITPELGTDCEPTPSSLYYHCSRHPLHISTSTLSSQPCPAALHTAVMQLLRVMSSFIPTTGQVRGWCRCRRSLQILASLQR